MTWVEFIHFCGEEIGRPEYWPKEGVVEQRHVNRAYSGLISFLNHIPLLRLTTAYSTSESTVTLSGNPKMGVMPSSIMDGRDDLGLGYVSVGGRVVVPENFIPSVNFFATHDNFYQEGNLMICLAQDSKRIFVSGTDQAGISVFHFAKPSKPTLASVNGGAVEWPLNDYDSEIVRQIVSAHATGVDANDSESLKIHQILANYYEGGIQ